jgi:NADH-quinone oxidoreductase subunit M
MLVLAGVYDLKGASVSGTGFAVVIAVGIVLGAWYLLTMLQRVFFGPLREPEHEGHAVGDLNARELLTIVPVAALCLLIGLYPQPVLDAARPEIDVVARFADKARERAAKTGAETPPVGRRNARDADD